MKLASEQTIADFKIGDRCILMAGGGPGVEVIGFFTHPKTNQELVIIDFLKSDTVPMCHDPRALLHPSRPI